MVDKPELKRIASEVVGATASRILMNRIYATLDDAPDPRAGAAKVEKIVALFLGAEQARNLERNFKRVLG